MLPPPPLALLVPGMGKKGGKLVAQAERMEVKGGRRVPSPALSSSAPSWAAAARLAAAAWHALSSRVAAAKSAAPTGAQGSSRPRRMLVRARRGGDEGEGEEGEGAGEEPEAAEEAEAEAALALLAMEAVVL